MKLIIRAIFSGEHLDLENWMPDNPDEVSLFVCVVIGPKEKPGADEFFIRVATPAGLAALESKDGILATRPLLVMRRYDFEELWRWVQLTVESCEADTWDECVDNLRLYFKWEYDYLRRR